MKLLVCYSIAFNLVAFFYLFTAHWCSWLHKWTMALLCDNIFDFVLWINLYLDFSSVWIMLNLEIIFEHPIFLFHIFSLERSRCFSFSFMIKIHRSWKMTIELHCLSFNQFNGITAWPILYCSFDLTHIIWVILYMKFLYIKKVYEKNWLSPGPKNQLDLPRR